MSKKPQALASRVIIYSISSTMQEYKMALFLEAFDI